MEKQIVHLFVFNTLADWEMPFLPGGEAWDWGENSKILESAKALLAANIPIAAICGATAGLARAGILDDISHIHDGMDIRVVADFRSTNLSDHSTTLPNR